MCSAMLTLSRWGESAGSRSETTVCSCHTGPSSTGEQMVGCTLATTLHTSCYGLPGRDAWRQRSGSCRRPPASVMPGPLRWQQRRRSVRHVRR